MPTILSHPAVPLAIGLGLGRRTVPKTLLLAGVIVSVLPDFDVIGFRLGIPYSSELGHRGFSHSLFVAAIVAFFGALFLRRYKIRFSSAALFLFVSMASHGLLDTFTTGGKGIGLLWPFSSARFFAPYQVIKVSPISNTRFLSGRGFSVLSSELLWVWLPAAALGLLLFSIRKLRRPNPPLNSDPAASGEVLSSR